MVLHACRTPCYKVLTHGIELTRNHQIKFHIFPLCLEKSVGLATLSAFYTHDNKSVSHHNGQCPKIQRGRGLSPNPLIISAHFDCIHTPLGMTAQIYSLFYKLVHIYVTKRKDELVESQPFVVGVYINVPGTTYTYSIHARPIL